MAPATCANNPRNTSSFDKFPEETIDHCIAFLWDDHSSLAHSSLVCRSWYTLSRPYMFRSIPINGEASISKWEDRLDTTPALRYWVRELRIRVSPALLWTSESTVHPFASRLEMLHSLRIIGSVFLFPLCIHPNKAIILRRNLATASTIREIFFDGPVSPSYLAVLLRSLRGLQSISMKDCPLMTVVPVGHHNPSSELNTTQVYHDPPPSLKSLTVIRHIPHLDHNILPETSLRSLEILHMREVPLECDKSYFTFIMNNLGPHLHSLSLEPVTGRYNYPEYLTDQIRDLLGSWEVDRLQGLRKLSVGYVTSVMQPFVLLLLNTLHRLPNVEEITMRGSFQFLSDCKPRSYAPLNARFAERSFFPALRVVHFLYSGTLSSPKAKKRILQSLPALPAREVKLDFRKVEPNQVAF